MRDEHLRRIYEEQKRDMCNQPGVEALAWNLWRSLNPSERMVWECLSKKVGSNQVLDDD